MAVRGGWSLTGGTTRRRLRLAACVAATLLAAAYGWQRAPHAGDEPAPSSPLPGAGQAAAPTNTPPAAAGLTEDSTLAQWKTASRSDRSRVAVALAHKRLGLDAGKLEIATTAMEISGCLTATGRDSRFDAWTLEPTAATCLTAPERPAN